MTTIVPCSHCLGDSSEENQHQEPGSALSGVRTRFGEGRGHLDRRRARGGLNPCARESKARTGRFLREKIISDHGLSSSYEGL